MDPKLCRECDKPLTEKIDIFREYHGDCLPRPGERRATQAEANTRPIFGEGDDDRPTE